MKGQPFLERKSRLLLGKGSTFNVSNFEALSIHLAMGIDPVTYFLQGAADCRVDDLANGHIFFVDSGK